MKTSRNPSLARPRCGRGGGGLVPIILVIVACLAGFVWLKGRHVPVEAPVQVMTTGDYSGQGKMVRVTNTGETPVELFFKAAGKKTAFTLGPGERTAFGSREGYILAPDDECQVGGEGFETATYVIAE